MIRTVEAEHQALPPSGSALDARAEGLVEALAEYHGAVDAGYAPSRDAFLQRYPEIAHELAGYLDGFDFVREVAPQLRGQEESANSTAATAARAALGDFQILREIGRGGMGVVYEAEQISLGRRVALKVLPFAAMLDKQQLTRFKNEARAAATLDHPNIVAIYSVGTERGVHYYAMQLVEGRNLAQQIAALRKTHGKPVDQGDVTGGATITFAAIGATPTKPDDATVLPAAETRRDLQAAVSTIPAFDARENFRTGARLGVQAAEALDHAHQNGILHRDVKPANLLVDESGKLWVTDFGLARLEADAGMTMTGDILGTLRYMSPEQALAKRVVVDHRSDIYSLGVTLYELLTLRPAYTGDDRQELLRQIAFEDPRKLRSLNAHIPADLETIVLKAIEKNPAQRYATAQDLAEDLRRFVQNQPIKAKPPTWRDRVVKWSRRHQVAVLASVVIFALTTMGLAISSLLIARERNAAVAARNSAIAARNEATDHFQLARDAVDKLITRVADEQLMNAPQMEQLRKRLLTDALEFYQQMLKRDSNNATLRHELALAQNRMGDVLSDLNRREEAEAANSDAVHRLRELTASDPELPKYKFSLAKVLYTGAYNLERFGGASGEDKFKRLAKENCGEAIDLLEELNRDFPDNLEYLVAMAEAYRRWSSYGDASEKIARLSRGRSVIEPLARAENATLAQKELYAETLADLGLRLKHGEEGRKAIEDATRYLRELMQIDATCNRRWKLAQVLWDGAARYPPDEIAEHIAVQEESVRLMHGLARDFPSEPSRRGDLAKNRLQLAYLYRKAGNANAAGEQLLQAKKLAEELSREFPDDRGKFLGLVSAQFSLVGHYTRQDSIEDWLRETEELRGNLLQTGAGNYDDFRIYFASLLELSCGRKLVARGRNAQGIEWGQRGFRRAWDHLGTASNEAKAKALSFAFSTRLDICDLLGELSINLYNAGDTKQATEFVEDLASLGRMYIECTPAEVTRPDLPMWATWFLSAWPQAELHDGELALKLARMMPEIEKSDITPWMKSRTLAVAHLRCGSWQAAIESIEKSSLLADQSGMSARGIDCLLLALAHWRLGNHPEARSWYSKAIALMDSPDYVKNNTARPIALDNDLDQPVNKSMDPRWSFFEQHLRLEVEGLMGTSGE